MKKSILKITLCWILILAAVAPIVPVSAADTAAEAITATGDWYNNGEGVNGEFVISTLGDLKYFMSLTDTFEGKTVYLGSDIVCNDTQASEPQNVFTPYGYSSETASPIQFMGTLDGRGYTVQGLYIQSDAAESIGFFASINNSEIKNISFDNCYLDTTNTSASQIGFIAGSAFGSNTFTNVYVNAEQNHASKNEYALIGGICGYLASPAESTFTNCSVDGSVTAEGANVVGGLVGANYIGLDQSGNIENGKVFMYDCVNYATVTCNFQCAGLIGGLSGKASLYRCMSFGKITAKTVRFDGASRSYAAASLIYARYKAYTAEQPTPTGSNSTDMDIVSRDCYHMASSATFPIIIHYNKNERDYSVHVYQGENEAGIYACRINTTARSTNYADAWNIKNNKFDDDSFSHSLLVSFEEGTTSALSLLGVQIRKSENKSASSFDARFVSTVTFDQTITSSNIKEVGFEARKLSSFLSDKKTQSVKCDAIYKAILTDYDTAEITAESVNADYLATLLLTDVPTGANTAEAADDDIQTVLIRSYCKADVDGAENTYHGTYSVITFINGKFSGGNTEKIIKETVETEDNTEESIMTNYAITEVLGKIRTLGRTSVQADGLACDQVASGIEFNAYIEGKLTVDVAVSYTVGRNDDCYFTLYIDGVRQEQRLKAAKNVTTTLELANFSEGGVHNIRLVKQTEARNAIATIKNLSFCGEFKDKPQDGSYLIEFLGDSLTVGYGNLTTSDNAAVAQTSVNQDGTQTYAYFAAQELDADVSVVAISGVGLVKGYRDNPMGHMFGIESFYRDQTTEFAPTRVPNIVVVNLGGNDKQKGVTTAEYKEGAIALIEQLRSTYGEDVTIIWINKTSFADVIAEIATEMNGVHVCTWTANTEGGTNHPDIAGHKVNAEHLIDLINEESLLK